MRKRNIRDNRGVSKMMMIAKAFENHVFDAHEFNNNHYSCLFFIIMEK
jgi:hypothetical protein